MFSLRPPSDSDSAGYRTPTITRMGMGSGRPRQFRTRCLSMRFLSRMLWLSLLLTLAGIAFGQSAWSRVIYLQGSSNPTFNLRFTELLQDQLGPETEIRAFSSLRTFEGPPGPVITLGQEALARVREIGTRRPVLALLIG